MPPFLTTRILAKRTHLGVVSSVRCDNVLFSKTNSGTGFYACNTSTTPAIGLAISNYCVQHRPPLTPAFPPRLCLCASAFGSILLAINTHPHRLSGRKTRLRLVVPNLAAAAPRRRLMTRPSRRQPRQSQNTTRLKVAVQANQQHPRLKRPTQCQTGPTHPLQLRQL